MKKKWLLIGGMAVIFFLLVSVIFGTRLKVISDLAGKSEELIVLKNKVWEVEFSKELDARSVNSQTVYVLDQVGKKQNVNVSLDEDKRTVLIEPPKNGYQVNSPHYSLVLKKGIKAESGRRLNRSIEAAFTVKETLPTIESKEKLNAYFLKLLKEQKYIDGRDMAVSLESSNEKSAADTAEQDHSETNVQVQGIDEADIVKTDGTHIYRISEGKVQIIRGVPADKMQMDSVLTFNPSFSPSHLFLEGNQLIVLGHSFKELTKSQDKRAADILIAPAFQSTKAIVYNVQNKQQPKMLREIEIEGSLLASRLMDGKVFMITSHYPDFWILERNEDADLRPRYSDTAQNKDLQIIDYNEIQYFPDSRNANYTNIAVMDLEDPKADLGIATYLGSGTELYMSKNNLYLAVPNYHHEPITTDRGFSPDSSIYKFSLNGRKAEFQNSAELKGTVLNQFSMDEYKGNFRVVTTKGQAWDDRNPSTNNLYILDENLKQIGQLEDLARGERIYSARFMNERIYMVTFKETDPLFVIDGSNPQKPMVLGELKIPGYSNYLHPLDENHLIGFGHDTRVMAGKGSGAQPIITTEGVKISLFDVSDMKNPIEKDTEIIGGRGTYSPLNYDHKALLFHKEKNLFAFPITVYKSVEGSQFESRFEFQGAHVYRIDPHDGIHLETTFTHQETDAVYEEWENTMERLIYIGDQIYILSPNTISAYKINGYTKTGELKLP
ncbi:beta-propeller domain-containing protein [Bacillus sp. ISL-47]|uniref:beta-propeller domain-containing protein n=1 Tax=Bacillus sp. ISL-47 TaxID=2819130 RepID=UPI001BEA1ACC|nr:beta-propeller domain-containing protein [Bacillus sp. ISL-47]MBT2688761.1 beta-propeller domain-containing protein [Bacillus sp. ISL-47]MBT2709933.1 beta-propeller domain-containing protein [Pseudomonas sp. ISL-84]